VRPNEQQLARLWQEQWLRRELETSDGKPLRVVFRGIWTHRRGPDFADALLDLAGTLLAGDIELHVRASDWYTHGHHDDPAYERVILHVVWQDDLARPVTRRDGRSIPTLELTRFVAVPAEIGSLPPGRPLGAIGFQHCAPAIAAHEPDRLRALLEEAGDRRLRDKVARVHARLALEAPGQTLYWLLADALGYHRNRDGMRAVAENLPLHVLEAALPAVPPEERFPYAAAMLLGTAGFLPLSDRERAIAALDHHQWEAIERAWAGVRGASSAPTPQWVISGTRPANHPLRRLLSLAALLVAAEHGVVAELCTRLQARRPSAAFSDWLTRGPVPVGRERTHEILVNVIVPFALAYGEALSDESLQEAAIRLWCALPAGRGNALTRATLEQICGPHELPIRTARAEQGLLQLYWNGCKPRRCHECPVAHLVLAPEETGPPPRA